MEKKDFSSLPCETTGQSTLNVQIGDLFKASDDPNPDKKIGISKEIRVDVKKNSATTWLPLIDWNIPEIKKT